MAVAPHGAPIARHRGLTRPETAFQAWPDTDSAVIGQGCQNTDADTGADTWVTYAELGKARGINHAAAKRLAMRRKWRRMAGNDGHARVLVPREFLTLAPGVDTDDDTGVSTPALSEAIDLLREQLEIANKRADRTEQALIAERVRADALRDQVAALEVQLAQLEAEGEASDVQVAELTGQLRRAREDAAELRQADADRQGRGRWRRLRAAWRGE